MTEQAAIEKKLRPNILGKLSKYLPIPLVCLLKKFTVRGKGRKWFMFRFFSIGQIYMVGWLVVGCVDFFFLTFPHH